MSPDMRAVREASHMNIKMDKALMFHKIRQGSNDAWASLNDQTNNLRSRSGQEFALDLDNRKPPNVKIRSEAPAFIEQ